MNKLSKILVSVVGFTALAVPATVIPTGSASAVEIEETTPTSRAKVDPNLTNITVYFNRRESKKIAVYGPAAVAPAVVVPWLAALVGVTAAYVNTQVFENGKCIKYVKPYVGKARFELYTGRHCR